MFTTVKDGRRPPAAAPEIPSDISELKLPALPAAISDPGLPADAGGREAMVWIEHLLQELKKLGDRAPGIGRDEGRALLVSELVRLGPKALPELLRLADDSGVPRHAVTGLQKAIIEIIRNQPEGYKILEDFVKKGSEDQVRTLARAFSRLDVSTLTPHEVELFRSVGILLASCDWITEPGAVVDESLGARKDFGFKLFAATLDVTKGDITKVVKDEQLSAGDKVAIFDQLQKSGALSKRNGAENILKEITALLEEVPPIDPQLKFALMKVGMDVAVINGTDADTFAQKAFVDCVIKEIAQELKRGSFESTARADELILQLLGYKQALPPELREKFEAELLTNLKESFIKAQGPAKEKVQEIVLNAAARLGNPDAVAFIRSVALDAQQSTRARLDAAEALVRAKDKQGIKDLLSSPLTEEFILLLIPTFFGAFCDSEKAIGRPTLALQGADLLSPVFELMESDFRLARKLGYGYYLTESTPARDAKAAWALLHGKVPLIQAIARLGEVPEPGSDKAHLENGLLAAILAENAGCPKEAIPDVAAALLERRLKSLIAAGADARVEDFAECLEFFASLLKQHPQQLKHPSTQKIAALIDKLYTARFKGTVEAWEIISRSYLDLLLQISGSRRSASDGRNPAIE